ncbi:MULTISPECIES: PTS sugar transporter subunit IIB [Lactobacillus]|uniref:PTS sugar transporter subunit IIB n=1 Tax=Lactobacillus TaxID=1578 RepID=UPI001C69EDCF|nr:MULTISPECIES: PTS sugar transporter subunit IIB [Lactobacillus]MCX8720703.1 PTS sugar transporter subunit IIB [Lactobacillus sp. B4010]MCX8731841.1 PTS sugar transporter subunit IIB [Lactobacillus sp. B4015]MCX8733885.1 PTS sugar transporter subunit IIB [Lactobacillus sp. B4012]QYN55954.1 PTS sugar transporter subunit IIB [Lactobacillus panisapium]
MANRKKNILFVCATGIATSTVATEKTLEYLKDKGISVTYTQTNVASLPEVANPSTVDLIVATTQVPFDLDIPVVHALSLITGIGADQTLEQIYDYVK